jgi:putative oxidoreductase
MKNPFLSDEIGKLVLRLTVGILMLFHGMVKVIHPGPSLDYIARQLAGIGLPAFVAWGVYFGEVLAPLMIIFGLFARIGGLIVAVNMVFAVLLAHSHQLMTLSKTGGWALELQGFYFFCGIAILLLGSGKFAVRSD